jgi:parallel beta-helix repeat protein
MSLTARLLLAVLTVGLLSAGFVYVAMWPSSGEFVGAQGQETRSDPDFVAGIIEEVEAAQIASVLEPMAAIVQVGPEQSGVEVLSGTQAQAIPTAALSGQVQSVLTPSWLNSTGTVFWVSGKADRTSPKRLDGGTVGRTAYIFLITDLRPRVVRFWIDDLRHTGTPDQIERNAPYDVASGNARLALPLRLPAGKHTVTAVVELANGQKKGFSATFTVGNVAQPVAGQATATTTTAVAPPTTARPTTTTTARPTATTAAPSANRPSGSIEIRPGDNVAAKIADAGNGATFFFQPGTYTGVSINPRPGQTFIAAGGVKFDGNGKAYAFRADGASNVTVRGFEIYDYRPANKDAAVMTGSNWLVQDNDIHDNGETGLKAMSGSDIIGNYIHHNSVYGITGSGSGILVADNEIAYNNTSGEDSNAGASKFVQTNSLVLRGNNVHHNYGNGLWVDINNVNALIEGNTVTGNAWNGIVMEISCGGAIRNNRVDGNATADDHPGWMAKAGILVANSPNVSVTGNRLSGNAKGIGGIHWDHNNRDAVTNCSPELRNFKVSGNVISQSGGAAAGIDAKINLDQVWSSWGNSFSGNTYSLSAGANFRWDGGFVDLDDWKSQGLN